MKNTVKRTYAGIVTQTTQAMAGLDLYAAPIGVVLVTRTAMNDKLVAYIAGGNTSTQEKTALSARRAALRACAKTAFDYLSSARDMLKTFLGRKYSFAWNEVGFIASLRVPRSEEKMIQCLQSMIAYFTAHAEFENAALNINVARTTAILNALTAARNAVNSQLTTLQVALSTRNRDGKELRTMVKALVRELNLKLDPLDERWASFGFNKPGARSVAAVPTGVIAMLVGPTSVALKWNKAARAERYRVYKKVFGVDAEMVAVETRDELDVSLEGLPSGKTIQFAITAVNSGGESLLSEMVSIVTT